MVAVRCHCFTCDFIGDVMEKNFKTFIRQCQSGVPQFWMNIFYDSVSGKPSRAEIDRVGPGSIIGTDGHKEHRQSVWRYYMSKKSEPNLPDDCKPFTMKIIYCKDCKYGFAVQFIHYKNVSQMKTVGNLNAFMQQNKEKIYNTDGSLNRFEAATLLDKFKMTVKIDPPESESGILGA